jgi:hypothetical protein
MTRATLCTRSLSLAVLMLLSPCAGPVFAQVTPAAGYTPPDDTPSFKVGATIFADYTYQDEPTKLDADGNEYNPSAFDVSRAYINVTGNINHLVSFRVTPDISRLTTKTTNLPPNETVSTSLDGSLTFRLKYAYGQFNLDNAWSKGSWVRFGVHHTPYVDWEENIYRYRFQGQIFVERDGYLSSSDFGASTHYNFGGNYGDIHAGYYNGDTYKSGETNDQQAFEARVSFRPAPMVGWLQGLRITGFYDADHYFQSDPRTRAIGAITYEHKRVRAGVEYIDAKDQKTGTAAEVKSKGYSIWATPALGKGWEALLRYDVVTPDKNVDADKQRQIGGVAYWFKTQVASAQAALLLDYEKVTYDTLLNSPDEKRYAFHTLFAF